MRSRGRLRATRSCRSELRKGSILEDAPVLFSSIKRSRSLSDCVVEEMTKAIVAGKSETGQALPPERDLCKHFDVSRTVVR